MAMNLAFCPRSVLLELSLKQTKKKRMRLDYKVMKKCIAQPPVSTRLNTCWVLMQSLRKLRVYSTEATITLASPLLELPLGRKSPKQLSLCLIEYVSILTPNDIFWLACLSLFYYSHF